MMGTRRGGTPGLQQKLTGEVEHVSYGDSWRTPEAILKILFRDGRYFDPCPFDPNGIGGLEKEWPSPEIPCCHCAGTGKLRLPVFGNFPGSEPMPWVQRAVDHPGPVVLLLKNDPTTAWYTYSRFFDVVPLNFRLHFSESHRYAPQTYSLWFKPKIPQGAD